MANGGTVLILMSGGLDSTTVAYEAIKQNMKVKTLHFQYGQRNAWREGASYEYLSNFLHMKYPQQVEHLPNVNLEEVFAWSKSRVMRANEGEEGLHVAGPSIAVEHNYIEQRNLVMLSCAASIAEQLHCELLGFGAKQSKFPDSSPMFFLRAWDIIHLGGAQHLKGVWTPFLRMDRQGVVERAKQLGVPINLTWSCYEGGERPCGHCGACVDRALAGV